MPATRCTDADVLGLHQRAPVWASRGGSWLVPIIARPSRLKSACSRMDFKGWFLVDITQHGEQGYVLE
jgi:hypothetical protein